MSSKLFTFLLRRCRKKVIFKSRKGVEGYETNSPCSFLVIESIEPFKVFNSFVLASKSFSDEVSSCGSSKASNFSRNSSLRRCRRSLSSISTAFLRPSSYINRKCKLRQDEKITFMLDVPHAFVCSTQSLRLLSISFPSLAIICSSSRVIPFLNGLDSSPIRSFNFSFEFDSILPSSSNLSREYRNWFC